LGFIPYGFLRPDVARHFKPRCASERVGFHGQVKLPDALAGLDSLDLKIVFTSSGLARHELATSLPLKGTLAEPPSVSTPEITPASTVPGQPVKLAAPNFFILGAAKCGTTSLYHALRQHPEVHLSSIKEPSFFSSGFQVVKNPVEYFNLFPEQEGKKRYGEASHVYFSAPESAAILRQLFPEAKFLLILRNPIHRAHSLYQHMKRSGDETLPTFELALKEEDYRFSDPVFRRECPQYFWNYMYCRSSMYDVQLGNYLKHFPREQFMVLTLGEWKSDPAHRQREIFQFLEIDPSVHVSTEPQNQAESRAVLREETRVALQEKFTGVRERLEAMIGRELQHWDY
ncbi:MAG: sulfotransferase domain-containing protein, partial [Roseimicrobium sp.]